MHKSTYTVGASPDQPLYPSGEKEKESPLCACVERGDEHSNPGLS
ncbi:hypothetical protein FHW88_003196 [Mucilaginibacter sp. SG538B]|nr:hypothetical protein [Mucilaginibacter sp. SG538B]